MQRGNSCVLVVAVAKQEAEIWRLAMPLSPATKLGHTLFPPHILSELAPLSPRRICITGTETYTTASTRDRHGDTETGQLKPGGQNYRKGSGYTHPGLSQLTLIPPSQTVRKKQQNIASDYWGSNETSGPL